MNDLVFPKRIAYITAHPDDETEISAGVIYLNWQSGGENYLYCATKGEKGKAYLLEDLSEDNLGKIRESELRKAGDLLGIKEIVVSDFKDGRVSDDLGRLETEIKGFVQSIDPDMVISFGPDGYSGHQDHIALSTVVKRITKELGVNFIEFAGPPETECPGFQLCLANKRKNGAYSVTKRRIANVKMPINREIKLSSMQIHKTQFAGLDPRNFYPEDVANHLLEYEYFYIEQ